LDMSNIASAAQKLYDNEIKPLVDGSVYTRNVKTASCASGDSTVAGVGCQEKCRSGYSKDWLGVCWENCNNYLAGTRCYEGSTDLYFRSVKCKVWKPHCGCSGDCRDGYSDEDACACFKGRHEWWRGSYYPKTYVATICPSGYKYESLACWQYCPSGFSTVGFICVRNF